ncbi:MAG: hypothetical protein IPM47_06105 [Sphingobacteriales bacterium]|nr:MAG: hypothetical protein IPM47_06105 [Sphingobacteriales bacterium]
MLLVYTNKITNRVRYIFEHIFKNLLGINMSITTDKEEFLAFEGAKLNYSSRRFDEELFFYASPLLFERGIKQQRLKIEDYEGTKIFFIGKNNSHLPFDPFAASFFLISRYEEYLPSEKDKYGRFKPENSVAFKNDFLHLPVIDMWVNLFAQHASATFPRPAVQQKEIPFCADL